MKRRRFPTDVETQLLVAYRRRCAVCYWLESDASEKDGQVAHIDRNPENNSLENAAWLCMKHHAKYDATSRQAKGFTPEEIRSHQKALLEHLKQAAWPDGDTRNTQRASRHKDAPTSLDLYDRRIVIYRAAIEFMRMVLKDLRPDMREILKFANETDEALFLFDDTVAEHLALLYKKALRLRAISQALTQLPSDYRTADLRTEEAQLGVWFSEQPPEIRRRFAPFLWVT